MTKTTNSDFSPSKLALMKKSIRRLWRVFGEANPIDSSSGTATAANGEELVASVSESTVSTHFEDYAYDSSPNPLICFHKHDLLDFQVALHRANKTHS